MTKILKYEMVKKKKVMISINTYQVPFFLFWVCLSHNEYMSPCSHIWGSMLTYMGI